MQKRKHDQLGLDFSTATARLKKTIMFSLVRDVNRDNCFRCGKKIETPEELSVEHKESWQDSEDPVKLFYDLNNIAFSHLSCNVKFKRVYRKYTTEEERIIRLREARRNQVYRRRARRKALGLPRTNLGRMHVSNTNVPSMQETAGEEKPH